MTDKVFGAFKAFDKKLKLDPAVTQQARDVADDLEQCLRDAGLLQSRLLQGSFGRKTMRPPLKDVDMVVVLPNRFAEQRTDNWDVRVGHGQVPRGHRRREHPARCRL